MARNYDGSPRKAKELLEALLLAESHRVPGVAEVRRQLGLKMQKRKAA
jgi:hypothetical protein